MLSIYQLVILAVACPMRMELAFAPFDRGHREIKHFVPKVTQLGRGWGEDLNASSVALQSSCTQPQHVLPLR